MSESDASAAESVPPARLAARIQPSVMGLEILREPDQCSHALARLVATEGEETFRVRVSTKPAAMDFPYAELRQPLSRDRIEVEQPVARAVRGEGNFRGGVAIEKSLAHFRANLVHLRADGGAEPRHDR